MRTDDYSLRKTVTVKDYNEVSRGALENKKDVSISFFTDVGNTITAIMWIDYPKSEPDDLEYKIIPLSSQDDDAGSTGRRNSKSKESPFSKKSVNKRLGVVIIVVILCCLPLVPLFSDSDTPSYKTMVLGVGTLEKNDYAGGMITIQVHSNDDMMGYDIIFNGVGACSWYIYSNDGMAYCISGSSIEKRGYDSLGTGSKIFVPSSVMHVGSYNIRAEAGGSIYEDTVVIDGEITTNYKWDYVGVGGTVTTNAVHLTYNYSDYYAFATDTHLSRNAYKNIADFAVVDSVINRLVEALGSEYIRAYYPPDSDWYINYLLAFVQKCFNYPAWSSDPDRYQYGQSDYFAYPLQTLFYGEGDCEDTSILAAALFESAGFQSAIALVYADGPYGRVIGHCVAGVNMVKTVSKYNTELSDYSLSYITVNNIVIYPCETTTSYQLAAGYLQSKYLGVISSIGKNINEIMLVTIND